MKILSRKYVFKKAWVRLLIGLVDTVGAAIFFWRRWFKRPAHVERILIIRIDQLGDVLLSLPALRALRHCYPKARMDVLVGPWARELMENEGWADEVYTYENSYFAAGACKWRMFWEGVQYAGILRKNRYDLAFDFRGDLRNALLLFCSGARRRIGRGNAGGRFLLNDVVPEREGEHELERNLRCVEAAGCAANPPYVRIRYPRQAIDRLSTRFSDLFLKAERPWIVVHIGSGYPSKRWPAGNFFSLIDKILAEIPASVVLVGQEIEEELSRPFLKPGHRVFNLIKQTSFTELCALLDQCDLFIGCDSAPAHVAAMLGKKAVILFSGTNDYRVWQPRGREVVLLRHPVPCSPCHERVCPLPRHNCMEDITVETVFEKVRECVYGSQGAGRN